MSCMGSPVQWSIPCIVKPCARHSLLQALLHEVQVSSAGCLMEGLFYFLHLTFHWNSNTSVWAVCKFCIPEKSPWWGAVTRGILSEPVYCSPHLLKRFLNSFCGEIHKENKFVIHLYVSIFVCNCCWWKPALNALKCQRYYTFLMSANTKDIQCFSIETVKFCTHYRKVWYTLDYSLSVLGFKCNLWIISQLNPIRISLLPL